jgi:transcriptional regulator with XRE-family HTH domain
MTHPNDFDAFAGANLQRWRKARGMSQAALAEILRTLGHGFQQQTVLKIEKGDRPLRLHEATDIAQVLDIELIDLARTPDHELLAGSRKVEIALSALTVALMQVRAAQADFNQLLETRGGVGDDPDVYVAFLSQMTMQQAFEQANELLQARLEQQGRLLTAEDHLRSADLSSILQGDADEVRDASTSATGSDKAAHGTSRTDG